MSSNKKYGHKCSSFFRAIIKKKWCRISCYWVFLRGSLYDETIYGDMCPSCCAEKEDSTDFQDRIPKMYGPPSIDYEQYNRPMPTVYGPPSGKRLSCLIKVIIGVFLGGIIAWLIGDCSCVNHPVVYGPPPVDSIQPPSPINNEY